MPHSFGYRARTRHCFARAFRKHGGTQGLTTYLRTYKLRDYVDVIANGAVHKGMPHRTYHGKTGRVWNVTQNGIGVELTKRVGHRVMLKRIHVRVEHVRPSRCQEEFKKRLVANDAQKKKWREEKTPKNKRFPLKRFPAGPKGSRTVKGQTLAIEKVAPLKYTEVY
ncbi:60S ribosomal protein L21-1 [Pelomyxa schiedti]|nr:60S ribosomal protein L21-1 [Pelomyxa schiedti]